MRRVIRWIDADERVTVGVELDERGVLPRRPRNGQPARCAVRSEPELDDVEVFRTDNEILELPEGLELLRPLDPPEVWCSGVTYERSRDARMEESAIRDVYADVYAAARPELFLKDAACRRTVGPGAPIGIRGDSAWNVPEPEIGLVLGQSGGDRRLHDRKRRLVARDRGSEPALPGPGEGLRRRLRDRPGRVRTRRTTPHGFEILMRITDERGEVLYEDRTTTAQMTRSFEELTSWLVRDNPIAPGTVLLTGTGLVPPDEFSLVPGHRVEIHVPEIGTLVNPVALASTLV